MRLLHRRRAVHDPGSAAPPAELEAIARSLQALALACALGCAQTEEATDERRPPALPLTPLVSGSDSAILEERLWVARSADEWARLWSEHTAGKLPAPARPAVDFERNMVIAVFLGRRPSAGCAVEVRSCEWGLGGLVVHAHETYPDAEPGGASGSCAPFDIVLVSRSSEPVRLRLDGRAGP